MNILFTKKIKRNNRSRFSEGFTLLEVLVTALIMGLLFAGVIMSLKSGQMAFREDIGLVNLQDQTRRAMYNMAREIRQSSPAGIDLTPGPGAITFSIPGGADINYSLNANNQIIRTQAGVPTVLGNNINNLNFSLFTGTSVQIQAAAQRNVQGRILRFPAAAGTNLTEVVELRN